MHLCYTIRNLSWKMAVVLLISLPMTGWGQCPTVAAILVDGCGTEQLNEFVIINSGGGFNTSDLQFSFDVNNNIIGPENNDINIDMGNLPGGPCGLQAGDPSVITGCANVISIGPGFNVPANSLVVLQTSDGANSMYNFSSVCGAGGCIYVIQSTCTRSAGGFTNSGVGMRTSILATTTGCSNAYTYNQASLMGGNGAYFIPPGTYGNGGCTAPPVPPAPGGPDFNDIPNPVVCGSYTLPAITGTSLTGNEAYYTGTNGTGTQYFPGEVISSNTVLFIYDTSSPCSDQESFSITVNPAPTANPAGPLSACANAMGQATFNLNSLNNTVNGGSGQPVNWFTNAAGTIPVGTPGAFTTGTTTVYAVVGTSPCVSTPVPVQLNVTPAPSANPAGPLAACDNTMGQATFNLNSLNNTVNGGSGQTVTWYTNPAATILVGTPGAYTTGTTTVYAVVGTSPCVSAPVAVQLNVTPLPPANPANLQACGNAMGQATFNLLNVNPTVTGGGPGTVSWWTSAAATTPIANPSAFIVNTPGGSAFATVTANGCTSDEVALIAITVNPTPTANPAGPLQACDQGGGQATFNLNSLNNTINGGSGTVNWYTNAAGTNPVPSPGSYTTGSGLVYATVTQGPCTSAPIPISLVVAAPPNALPASLTECATAGNTATFNLNDANSTVNGGTGNTVTWYSNAAGTVVIGNPASFTTPTVTVYARVDNGACQSAPVAVQLVVNTPPAANAATFNVCVVSVVPPVAVYDLPGLINAINGGTGNTVNWYTNAAGTNPLDDITDVTTLPNPVYATVTNAAGCESPTVAIPVNVTFAPPASSAMTEACGNSSGQATFNLTTLNNVINQGQPNTVNFFTNMAATMPIANPAAFVATGTTTVYAVVSGPTGCSAAPVAVTLIVIPLPVGVSTSMTACDNGSGQAVFNLNTIDGIVLSGLGGGVNWYTNMTLTTQIVNPMAYTSGTATIYAVVIRDGCTAQPVPVMLNVTSGPATSPASLSGCDNGSGQAVFNLTSLNNTVNVGSGNAVSWFTNMAATNPVANPAAFTSGNTTVYAIVNDGFCSSQPVAVSLTVTPAPGANPTSLSACDNGSGQAIFNLTSSNPAVNGNTGSVVDWYLNAAATMPIANPAAFTSGAATVYAVVDNGICTSAPVPVTLNILAIPAANPASLTQCATAGNQATFNLNSLNNTVNGGNGNTVNWFSNAAGTTPIGNPGAFTTASVTVYARTTNGQCISQPVAVTLTVTPAPVASPASLQACNSGSGTATFNLTSVNNTVNGGSGNTVNWFSNSNGTGPVATPANFTSGSATVYAVVTNGTCSSAPVAVTLTISPAITLALVVAEPISCNTATDGSLDLTVTGGTMPFNYDWNVNTLDGMQDPTGLGNGTYAVTVTDFNGCQNNASITLNQPAALVIACAQATPVSTIGGSDGTASVTINGGTAPYTITWSGAASGSQMQATAGTATLTGLVAGSYNVTVTDANSCMATCNFIINDPACSIQVTATFENPGCPGNADGSINLTVTGGETPFDFNWSEDALDDTEDPVSLDAGQYTVTITDNNGCQATTSVTLTDPAAITLACAQASPASTIGGNDGTASVTINNGAAPYTITWSGAAGGSQMQATAGTATLTGLVAGNYNVTVTDANNCTATCNFTINDPGCNTQVTATFEDPTCADNTDGSIDLTVTGTMPFEFDWDEDTLDDTEDPASLGAGTYSVTVTDDDGCQATTSVTLTAPPALTLSCGEDSPVSSPGATDGAAIIQVSGGTAPYTLLWAGPVSGTQTVNAAGDVTIPDLPAGIYTLTMTDENGCSEDCSFTISTLGCALAASVDSTHITPCFGATDGVIFLEVLNATGTLQYNWNVDSLDNIASPSDLAAGLYTVIITDQAGCADTVSVTLSTPTELVIACTALSAASGPTTADGSAELTFGGGTPPYELQLDGPSSRTITSDTAGVLVLTDLLPGLYSFSLTDTLDCTASDTCSFVICGDMVLTLSGEPESCAGDGDGSASVAVTGGLAPFTYAWSVAGEVNDSIINLISGTYYVTVTDQFGVCSAVDSIELLTLPLELVCGQQTPVSTPTATDGEASVIIEGGSAPYTLTWSGAGSGSQPVSVADTVIIGGLATGVYALTLTDVNGCTQTCSFTISAPGCDLSAIAAGQNENCPGAADGAIELTLTGGTLPFTFDWNDNTLDGMQNPAGLSPGTYSVTITDMAGCIVTNSVVISTEFTLPDATLGAGGTICEDDCFDFAVTLTGTAPFTVNYTLDTGTGPQALSATFAGTSGVIAVCPADFSLTSGAITLSLTDVSDATCANTLTASAVLAVNAHSADTLSPTLCPGEVLVVNGNTYDENRLNGVEVIAGVNPVGCDSILTISLSYFPPATGSYTATLCAGETVTIGTTTFSEANPSGTAILPNTSVNGCDSTVLVNLTFLQPVTTDLSPALCPGETLTVNGNTYDETTPSGQEILISAQGCDSIVNILLTFYPAAINNLNQTLCEGESLTVNGTVYDEGNPSGTEVIAGSSANGCDSTIVVALQFVAPVTENLMQTLCPSGQITVNGTVYDENNPSGTEVIPGGSANGCDSTIVVALSFFTAPTTNITETLCSGESITVGGTVYDETNPSGTELLQSTNGCDSTVVVSLSFHPVASAQLNQTLCSGESLTVNGTVYNANNPSGTEVITGGAATGCDSTVVVNLSFSAPITATIAGSTAICAGNSATLTLTLQGAATTFNVTYSPGGGAPVTVNNVSNGATLTVSPGTTTTYTLLSATAVGSTCPVSVSGSATVSVSSLVVQAQVTSDFLGFGVSCPGSEDGSALATPVGGLAPYTYVWSDGQTNAEAQGLGAATYTVTLTDAAGCTGSATVILTAPEGINAAVSGVSPTCYSDRDGSILIESLSGGNEPYMYSVDGGIFQTLPAALPFTIPGLDAGVYDLVIRDANGCTTANTANVPAAQELMLDLGEDRTIKLGDSTLIQAQANFDIAQVQWTPVLNLSTPGLPDSYASPMESTAYRLTATDANGCNATDVVMIFVNTQRQVYVPNVFSPNGDGLNDLFTVFGGNDVVKIRTFIIFDRWGNMLFQNGPFQPNDLQHGWDGTFDGEEMNSGVYVFYAEVVFADGETEVFKGDVTLLR